MLMDGCPVYWDILHNLVEYAGGGGVLGVQCNPSCTLQLMLSYHMNLQQI